MTVHTRKENKSGKWHKPIQTKGVLLKKERGKNAGAREGKGRSTRHQAKLNSLRLFCIIVSLTAQNTSRMFSVSYAPKGMQQGWREKKGGRERENRSGNTHTHGQLNAARKGEGQRNAKRIVSRREQRQQAHVTESFLQHQSSLQQGRERTEK